MSKVLTIGEAMGLLIAEEIGPLEEVEHFSRHVCGAELCFPSYSHRTIWIGLMRWTAANISEMIRIHSRGSSNAARPSFTTVMKCRIMGRKEHFHDTAL